MRQPDLFSGLERQHSWTPPNPPSLDGEDTLFFDVETTGLDWAGGDLPVGIAIRTPEGRSWYLPWAHGGGGNLDESVMKRWARNELKGRRLIGAGIKFDGHEMQEWGVDLEEIGCELSDIQHYAALLDDSRRRFALDILGKEFLGYGKIKGLQGDRISDYHAGEVHKYAERDVELVHKLHDVFWPMMDEQDLQRVRQLEDDVIFPVIEMERNGSPIDVELLKTWGRDAEQEALRCIDSIFQETDLYLNPNSPLDMEQLFSRRGIPIQYTETGQVSIADAVFEGIEDEPIKQARRFKKLGVIRSKYLIPYLAAVVDGILRYQLHQLRNDSNGTVSGRFSSSNKNIQQVLSLAKHFEKYGDMYVIRELFIPGSGLYLSADAAQIEFRLFAHFAKPPDILKAYRKNPWVSYHKIVWKMVKALGSTIGYKQLKNLNFAKLYGAGFKRIAEMIGLPRSQSDVFVHQYNKRFPETVKLLKDAADVAEKRGYVKTIMGRRARFPKGWGTHKAISRVIQGSAGDIMKKKLVELHKERKKTGFVMRVTNHDEVCGDAPDEESAKMVKEILNRQSFELEVPILWEMKTGKNWRECA